MKIDWPEYRRNHADRRNLLIHIGAVPLFVGAIFSLPLYVFSGDIASIALLASASLVMQGRGHAQEKEPPRPFTAPLNFLQRWITEQFVLFPLFLLSSRWWNQYNIATINSEGNG